MRTGPGTGEDGRDECCEVERLSQLMDGEWQGVDLSRSVKGVCDDDVLRAKWTRFHLVRDALRQEPLQAGDALATRISDAIANEPAYSNVTPLGGSAETVSDTSPEVMAAGDEAATVVAGSGRLRTWATGVGLAASVAVVTVMGLDAWQTRGGLSTDAGRLALTEGASEASDVESTPAVTTLVADAGGRDETDQGGEVLKVRTAPLPQVQLVANTGAYWVAPESAERRSGGEDRLNMMLSQHIEYSPTAERHGMLPYSRLVGYDEADVAR